MNSFTSLFSSNHKKFLKLKKNQKNKDESWDERAVESLVKKLAKNKPDALKTLESVLEQQCPNTPCVTINKTQDGRNQIYHRKIFPHVAYCKVWRWPDLKNHNEHKQNTEYCKKSFYSKQDEVCINPYHYERVQPSLCASSPQSFNANSLSISNSSFSSSFNEQSLISQSIENSMNHANSIDHSINNSVNQSMNQSLNDQSLNHSYYMKVESPQMSPKAYSDFNYSNSHHQINNVYDSLMGMYLKFVNRILVV